MDLQSHVEPESANTNPNTAAVRPNKPWKLRQTCDLCSEAKIKCDKRNPRCGRCERLSYECMYSPARRIGRPRPRSPRTQETRRAAGADSVHTDRDSANKDYAAQQAAARPAELPEAARHQDLNEALPDCFSDDAGAGAGASAGPSVNVDANASISATADASNNSNARINDVPQPSSIGDALFTSDTQPSMSMHDPYEVDCATVAVATLKKLSSAGLEGGQSPSQNQINTARDVLADQIPHACKQAARILVCPCSADMDTALLAASLAGAILDVADAALRSFRPAGHAPDAQERTVLALGTLTNISQVVTLFTHRYSATQASRPPEALKLLAASLRTTLKAMAEETTNRFFDGGSAPTRVKVPANDC